MTTEKKGKMVVTITKLSRNEFDKIMRKVSFMCGLHGKTYHARFTPYKSRVKK